MSDIKEDATLTTIPISDIKEEATLTISENTEKSFAEKMLEKLMPIDVLHFDRSVRKKCRFPNHRQNLVDILRTKIDETQPNSVEKYVEILPKNFCKKDTRTGIQKQFECQACSCLMESLQALTAHVQGEKHLKAIVDFVPRLLAYFVLIYLDR